MAKLKSIPNQPVPTVHFDDRTALHLVRAFHQETDLVNLLQMILAQVTATCGGHGLSFQPASGQQESLVQLGRTTMHHLEYKLDNQGSNLGTLTLFFPQRKNDAEIQTCEDLLGLAFSALRTAIALNQPTAQVTQPPAPTKAAATNLDDHTSDALILVGLDGYAAVKENDGEEWAHALMSSVHTQIQEGLRQADGVYQISNEFIAILLPNTSRTQALDVADKVRVLVASLHLRAADVERQLTCCMGIADAVLANSAEEVMSNAKVALSKAQSLGLNQVYCYDEALVAELRVRQ